MAAAPKEFLEISPHIQKSINDYNDVLKKLAVQEVNNVYCLEPFTVKQMQTMACDEMHYNEIGHRATKDQIIEILKKR